MGGITLFFILRTDIEASRAPPAPSKWPVIDFVELIDMFLDCSPKTDLIAIVSYLSLSGVEVPWAFIYDTSFFNTFAWLRAFFMALAPPSPPGAG